MSGLALTLPAETLEELEAVLRRIIREELEALDGAGREVFTIAQSASFLGCSTGRIYNLRSEGRLPSRHEGGRAVQLREDLLGLVETQP